jgi:hypothetical protein
MTSSITGTTALWPQWFILFSLENDNNFLSMHPIVSVIAAGYA